MTYSKCLALILFVGLTSEAAMARATTFYLSATGNDGNSGTSEASPWRSIDKLNASSASIHAGDSILFNRGDTFYGGIVVSVSGTAGSPITYGAYGSTALPLPIITGLSEVSAWSADGTNIYAVDVPNHGAYLTSVIIGETIQPMGRYPRADAADYGYLSLDSTSAATNLTDSALASAPNFNGGEAVIRLRRWILMRAPITSHSGGTLTFTPTSDGSRYSLSAGTGYFIQNHRATLTQNGDWYYDAATGTLHMYYTSTPPAVRVPSVDHLLTATGRDYITINNLSFVGCHGNAIDMHSTDNVDIQHNEFHFAGTQAGYFQNTSFVNFSNNLVQDSLNNALIFTSSISTNYTIRSNTLLNTGLIAGMGSHTDELSHEGMRVRGASDMVVEYNTLTNTGFLGIEFYGNRILIKNNVIDHYCFVKDDSGGIYTWNGGSDPSVRQWEDRVITGNIVMNGVGAPTSAAGGPDVEGIYMDNNTNHVDINNNTVFSIHASAFYANSPTDMSVTDNTFYDSGQSIGLTRYIDDGSNPTNGGQDLANVTITGNVRFPRRASQYVLRYSDLGVNFPSASTIPDRLRQIGSINGNFDAQPNPFSFAYSYKPDSGVPSVFPPPVSFQTWRNWTGYDSTTTVLAPPATHAIASIDSANLYSNGEFASNIDDVGSYSGSSNHELAWDGSSKLTGTGSLRLSVATPVIRSYTTLFSVIGPVDSSKNYVVRFSTLGTNDDGHVTVSLRNTAGSSAETITAIQEASFGTTRVDHEFVFEAPAATTEASWQIAFLQTEGDTFLDDVEIFEADAELIDLDRYLRFEYNAGRSDRTVDLDAEYADARGTHYTGTITLAPFTSVVLVRVGDAGPPIPDAGVDGGIALPDGAVLLMDGAIVGPDGEIIILDAGPRDYGVSADGTPLQPPSTPLAGACACNVGADSTPRPALLAALFFVAFAVTRRRRRQP